MTDRIYCEDCRFILRSTDLAYSRCGNPKAESSSVDRFTARACDTKPYCSTMRATDCGHGAKLFEPAPEAECQGEAA